MDLVGAVHTPLALVIDENAFIQTAERPHPQ